MTIIVVITEIGRGYKINRRFKLDVDNGKDFCYRSRASFSAFFHGSKQYNWKGAKELNKFDMLYHTQDLDSFIRHVEIFAEVLGKPVPEGYDTLIDAPNLWEFYKIIGWNYKTKKWSKG